MTQPLFRLGSSQPHSGNCTTISPVSGVDFAATVGVKTWSASVARPYHAQRDLALDQYRWGAFVRYTSDGSIRMENNIIGRLLRPIAIGRKTFVFFGCGKGAPSTTSQDDGHNDRPAS